MKKKFDAGLILIPRLASLFIRAVHLVLRVRHLDAGHIEELNRAGKRYIVSFWHGHILLIVYCRYVRPMRALISQHRDGELIARTMGRFGVDSSRGSSTRRGAGALREMISLATSGTNLAFTPDGPRGPRRVVQKGVLLASQAGGIPIVPVIVVSEKKIQLRSWDRFEIPKPLSRVLFVYGAPIEIPRRLSPDEFEAARLNLERVMNALADDTEKNFESCWKAAESR
ncbi:MAG: lysophospholipid acyltransferase family protein [Thermoanaerobaculia bacterium]